MYDCQVFIIGGGPAGAATGCLLAQQGVDVLLVDKAQFPRFHVGESLIPMVLPVTDRMGIDLSEGDYLFKQGAEFLDEATGQFQFYSFADSLPGVPDHAYQVERSLFDAELLDAVRKAGGRVQEDERAKTVEFDGDGVTVLTSRGEYRARFLVDASGSNQFLTMRNRSMQAFTGFGRAACFTRYEGVSAEVRAELEEQGNVKIMRTALGWAWVIPLTHGRVSIGAVAREKFSGTDLLDQVIAASPLLTRITAGAERIPVRRCGDFSYRSRNAYGPRFAQVGDAAAFLDPIFSSGITLAMQGAAAVADTLAPAVHAGSEADPALMAPVSARMNPAYGSFYDLIDRFYHTAILDNFFFATDPDPIMRKGLITMLAGDIWRDDNPFQNMLFAGKRRNIPVAEWVPGEGPMPAAPAPAVLGA